MKVILFKSLDLKRVIPLMDDDEMMMFEDDSCAIDYAEEYYLYPEHTYIIIDIIVDQVI